MREESRHSDGDGNGIGRQTGRKEILSNVDARWSNAKRAIN